MKTLQNVLKFIELKGFKTRVFEQEAGLSNGTLSKCFNRNAELSSENIDRIVEKFSTELIAAGFSIIDLSSVGGEGKAIMSQEEKANVIKYGVSFIESTVNEPSIPYQISDSAIEIYTSAGKKSFNVPANKNEVVLLNALLAEKDERQKESDLRAEKAEQRAQKAEQEKDRLLSIIEQNLTTLLQVAKGINDKLGGTSEH
jgi:hypothetical protein